MAVMRDELGRLLPGSKLNEVGSNHRKIVTRALNRFNDEERIEEGLAILWDCVLSKKPWALKLWMEHTFGKPKVKIEHQSSNTEMLRQLLEDTTPLLPVEPVKEE